MALAKPIAPGKLPLSQSGIRRNDGVLPERSGTVFNAASINWVTALSQQEGLWNSAVQITWNVFNRLSGSLGELVSVPDVFKMSATIAAKLVEAAGLERL